MDEIITIEKKKEKKKVAPFIAGILILALAIFGLYSIISMCVDFANKGKDTEDDYARYGKFLTWVVGVDPEPFSDITKADKDDLRNIAICSLLTDKVKTGKYQVTDKGMIVPAVDVEKYYTSMFGKDTQIVHANVQGYGYEFIYDAGHKIYIVPLTGATPPFAARIDSCKKTGAVIELRVGYVGTGNVEIKPDGTLGATEPDKYADITLKEVGKGFNLISLKTITIGEGTNQKPNTNK